MRGSPILLVSGIIAGLILFSSNIASAQDYTTGLVGHWKMDETSGSTIVDSSGSSNTGTWTDGTGDDVAEETTAGHDGTAIDFDGVDDYISYANNINFDNNDFTISSWIYIDGASGGTIPRFYIFSQRVNNTGDGEPIVNLYVDDSSGNLVSDIRDNVGQIVSATGTISVNYGTWNHVAVVKTGSSLTLYVNNYLDTSQSHTLSGDFDAGAVHRYIGKHRYLNTDYSFSNGKIDDLRVYNRALSAADISALYNSSDISCSNPNGVTGEMRFNKDKRVMQYCNSSNWVAIGAKKTALNNGLIGHWGLDETTGTTAADLSGNGNDGAMTGGLDATTDSVNGAVDSALNFDGISDYIQVTNDAVLNNVSSGEVSISAWVHISDTGVTQRFISKYDIAGGAGSVNYTLWVDSSDEFKFCTGECNPAQISSAPAIYDQWVHLVGIHDGTNTTLYVNNIAQTSAVTPNPPADSNWDLFIATKSDLSEFMNGKIDDIRIYNRALSVTEIGDLYNLKNKCTAPSTNLIGHWKLDETSGSVINDSIGVNNGTWSDSTGNNVTEETTDGQDGNAIDFDGVDDYINIPDNASLDFGSSDFTVSTWVKKQTAVSSWDNSSGISKWNDGGSAGTNEWLLDLGGTPSSGSDDRPSFAIESGITKYSVTSPATMSLNQWYLLTGIREGDNIKIYVDGNLKETTNVGNIAVNNVGRSLIIGNYSTYYTDAVFDDLRIYNRALTTTEVEQLYGATGGTCTSHTCTSPLGFMGEIIYNADYNVMQYCDGSNWIAMGRQGDGGAGCSNPAGLEAEIIYNSDLNTLQYCEGDEWISVISQR